MKAVILAGGLGSRLRPFTQIIPKPLLPIGEKSVLEIQIEHLKKHGFNEIFLATNYKSEYIENFFGDGSRFGIKLKISKEDKPLGTAGPITLLKNELTDPFLMMNGDILTLLDYKNFYDFAVKTGADLTISVKEYITPFQFGNIEFEGDYVTYIKEKPQIRMNVLAGIYIFRPEIFRLIPDNTFFGMDLLIDKMLNEKIPVAKYQIYEYWLDIGQVDDYEKAQEIYKTHFSK
ncbi:MAG TPA: sugar phosphate nucleotidyltransferase [Bacteroidales bacterium]|nr:sugar phosphate nucleotidyltransferase [Bacteroidales bacterium]HPI85917.1 sugar phosphate nucleotidyltransferase [Bacteroidales bacterium]HPM91254.1 sugar phosphate nucleotidyltransferase [Bacteroidales bacterium]